MAKPTPPAPETTFRFSFPSAYTFFALIVIIAGLTWVIPAGQYWRVGSEALGKDVPAAGTYAPTEANLQGFFNVILAPIAGFYDPGSYTANAIDVALFVLMNDGFIGVVTVTEAIDACIICAGGGSIAVIRNASDGTEGVEAMIEKDRTSTLLALGLGADALLLLTDVPAVCRDLSAPNPSAISPTMPEKLGNLELLPGSMGPKVAAAVAFATTSGKLAGIGQLTDARAIIEGRAGTRVLAEQPKAGRRATDETSAQQPFVSGVRGNA